MNEWHQQLTILMTAQENKKLEGYPSEALKGPNTQSRDECERRAATLQLNVCHLVTLLALEPLYFSIHDKSIDGSNNSQSS